MEVSWKSTKIPTKVFMFSASSWAFFIMLLDTGIGKDAYSGPTTKIIKQKFFKTEEKSSCQKQAS